MPTGQPTAAIVVLVGGGAEVACWSVRVRWPDLAAVEAIARLQLGARRRGWRVEVRDPCLALRELLDLVGLADLIAGRAPGALLGELGGKPEEGEELGTEEVVVARDLPV